MNGIRFICFFALLCMFTVPAPLYADANKKEQACQKKPHIPEPLLGQTNVKPGETPAKGQLIHGVQLPLIPPLIDDDQKKIVQKLPDFSPLIDAMKDLRKIDKAIRKKSASPKILKEQRKKTVLRIFQIGKKLRENYDGQLKNIEKQEKACQNKINQETNDRMIEKFQKEMDRILSAKEKPQLKIDIINHYLFEAIEQPMQEDDIGSYN